MNAGRVEYDDESKVFHGEVLGLRDVVTFEGRSVKELERAFKDSVDDYLTFCKERGEPPEKPFSGQFVARIGPGLHRELSVRAQLAGKSLNTMVTETLQDALKRQAPPMATPKKRAKQVV